MIQGGGLDEGQVCCLQYVNNTHKSFAVCVHVSMLSRKTCDHSGLNVLGQCQVVDLRSSGLPLLLPFTIFSSCNTFSKFSTEKQVQTLHMSLWKPSHVLSGTVVGVCICAVTSSLQVWWDFSCRLCYHTIVADENKHLLTTFFFFISVSISQKQRLWEIWPCCLTYQQHLFLDFFSSGVPWLRALSTMRCCLLLSGVEVIVFDFPQVRFCQESTTCCLKFVFWYLALSSVKDVN